jgi:hypothetical protein
MLDIIANRIILSLKMYLVEGKAISVYDNINYSQSDIKNISQHIKYIFSKIISHFIQDNIQNTTIFIDIIDSIKEDLKKDQINK